MCSRKVGASAPSLLPPRQLQACRLRRGEGATLRAEALATLPLPPAALAAVGDSKRIWKQRRLSLGVDRACLLLLLASGALRGAETVPRRWREVNILISAQSGRTFPSKPSWPGARGLGCRLRASFGEQWCFKFIRGSWGTFKGNLWGWGLSPRTQLLGFPPLGKMPWVLWFEDDPSRRTPARAPVPVPPAPRPGQTSLIHGSTSLPRTPFLTLGPARRLGACYSTQLLSARH